jgi:hypothetical protein
MVLGDWLRSLVVAECCDARHQIAVRHMTSVFCVSSKILVQGFKASRHSLIHETTDATELQQNQLQLEQSHGDKTGPRYSLMT